MGIIGLFDSTIIYLINGWIISNDQSLGVLILLSD